MHQLDHPHSPPSLKWSPVYGARTVHSVVNGIVETVVINADGLVTTINLARRNVRITSGSYFLFGAPQHFATVREILT